jgi:glycosyltransferase involved in cell wall biosynthesis
LTTAVGPDARVSVVIITRNRPAMLVAAVASALQQSIAPAEVVVVDDLSDPPIVREPSWPDTVRVVRPEVNLGVSGARDLGLRSCTGDWVTFLDDDDVLRPAFIEQGLAAVASSDLPAPVASIQAMEVVDEHGRSVALRLPVSRAKGERWLLEGAVPGRTHTADNTLLAPRSVLIDAGGWDGALRSLEKDDFFLRINAICSIQGLDAPLYEMRVHGGPRIHKDDAQCGLDMAYTEQKHRDLFRTNPSMRSRYLATAAVYLLLGRGGYLRSVRLAFMAVRAAPTSGYVWRRLALCLLGPLARAGRALRSGRGRRLPVPGTACSSLAP